MPGSTLCRMRCPRCRHWIDVPCNAKKLPLHEVKYSNGEQCAGSNQPPAEKRGPFSS